MKQRFLQSFQKRRSYIRGRIQQIPMQASTPFEQKILNGWFEVVGFIAVLLPLPGRNIDKPDTARNQFSLRPKAAIRLVQLCCLLWSILLVVLTFAVWGFLFHKIQLVMNHPSVAMEYKPNTFYGTSHLFLGIVSIPLTIYVTMIAIVTLRLKNFPLLFRISLFCSLGGMISSVNQIWDFRMPVAVWLSGRMLGVMLTSIGAFCWLLCVFYIERWEKSGLCFKQLPMDETNES